MTQILQNLRCPISLPSCQILALLLVVGISCGGKTQYPATKNEIQAGVITSLFPNFVKSETENRWDLKNYDSQTVKLFFYKELALYRIYYNSTAIKMRNGIVVETATPEVLFYNLVFSTHSHKVLKFDSTDLKNGVLLNNRDSLFLMQPILGFDIDGILEEANYNLISSTSTATGIQEKYTLIGKSDSTKKGSMTLSFSRDELKNFPYSLGKKLEKKKGMRLIEAEVTTDGRYMEPGNYYLAETTIPTSIRQVSLSKDEQQEIRQIFDQAAASVRK